MKRLAILLATVALAGCADNGFNEPTAASGYNGTSVTIDTDHSTPYTDQKITSEAQRLCAIDGKRAEYASTTSNLSAFKWMPIYHHMFVCLS